MDPLIIKAEPTKKKKEKKVSSPTGTAAPCSSSRELNFPSHVSAKLITQHGLAPSYWMPSEIFKLTQGMEVPSYLSARLHHHH